jgi:hypothetical protein
VSAAERIIAKVLPAIKTTIVVSTVATHRCWLRQAALRLSLSEGQKREKGK